MILKRIKDFFSETVVAECGHKTKRKAVIEIDGRKEVFSCQQKKIPFCFDCFLKMRIICPWCGRSIFPGDPITLYTLPEERGLPSGSIFYDVDTREVVGCLNCVDTGADRAGFWVPPGKVKKLPNPFNFFWK